MAYTQDDIDRLKAVIASGVQRANYNGRDVTYASLDKLIALLRIMEAEVGAATGVPVTRRSYASFSKGYVCRRERW